jgi:flavoprotein
METTAPGGKVMVYPRKIDLEATDKIREFEYTTVVESVNELSSALQHRLQQLS